MSANSEKNKAVKDRDERVRIPLDPEEALRGLLEVDPEAEPEPVEDNGERRPRA